MFAARAYIQQIVGNPFFSEFLYLRSSAGGLGQTINITFANENVKLCYITFLQIDSLISPVPPFGLFSNIVIPIVNVIGVSGSGTVGNFYYITRGDTIRIDSNNANVGFVIIFQKVYSSADKVYKER
jgi:hypothetical protein